MERTPFSTVRELDGAQLFLPDDRRRCWSPQMVNAATDLLKNWR